MCRYGFLRQNVSTSAFECRETASAIFRSRPFWSAAIFRRFFLVRHSGSRVREGKPKRRKSAALQMEFPKAKSLERGHFALDRGDERATADQTLDGLEIPVQRAITSERADVLANVLVG